MSSTASMILSLVGLFAAPNSPAVASQPPSAVPVLARTESFSLRFPSAASYPGLEELPPPALGMPAPGLLPRYQALPSLLVPSHLTPAYVPTHREFAASFQPLPGNYEVMLLHPYTDCPVRVCFRLPDACLKKVHVDRNELEFDYGKHEVEIKFKRNGRVEVELD
jgi:hypothetical protein